MPAPVAVPLAVVFCIASEAADDTAQNLRGLLRLRRTCHVKVDKLPALNSILPNTFFFWTSLPYFINRMSLVPQRKFLLGDSLFDQSEANEVRFPPKKSNYIFFVFLVKTGPACMTD